MNSYLSVPVTFSLRVVFASNNLWFILRQSYSDLKKSEPHLKKLYLATILKIFARWICNFAEFLRRNIFQETPLMWFCVTIVTYTVPKEIDFPRYNMKCRGENVILHGKFHVVSCFPLHIMLYRGNLDYFSVSVLCTT